jgi:hypothetical protein
MEANYDEGPYGKNPTQYWAFWTRANNSEQAGGAQERTRTFTAVKPLAPEASASTNSATWARGGLVRTG